MQDICVYCDKCYSGNVSGLSKHMCLNCLEHIVDNSIYEDINPLKNYNISYDKNKITCEMCNQYHNLFVTVNLCSKHKKQLKHLYDRYEYDNCDTKSTDSDYYDHEDHENHFNEIKNEITKMLRCSNLNYKITQLKDEYFKLRYSHYIFVYQNNVIVCKFIYQYDRLALIFNNKIYTTSRFYDTFREMYFGKLDYKLLEITEILSMFKNHFNIKYSKIKNFDHYIKVNNIKGALVDRFEYLNDLSITYHTHWYQCNDCESYNKVTRFIYNSNEILRVITNKDKLIVCIKNKIYTNEKDQCLHLDSTLTDKSEYFNFKCLDFSIDYNTIEYKSYLEIYKLIINYPSRLKEKRSWSDITKSNI